MVELLPALPLSASPCPAPRPQHQYVTPIAVVSSVPIDRLIDDVTRSGGRGDDGGGVGPSPRSADVFFMNGRTPS